MKKQTVVVYESQAAAGSGRAEALRDAGYEVWSYSTQIEGLRAVWGEKPEAVVVVGDDGAVGSFIEAGAPGTVIAVSARPSALPRRASSRGLSGVLAESQSDVELVRMVRLALGN